MARINTIAEAGIFNINQAQGRYGKSSTELSSGNRNLSRDISSSIIVGQLDSKSQTIRKVREGLIYMKNMFTTAHTGTQNLLNNLTEQQNLIRAAGSSNSAEVLAQLKTALDAQITSFIRIVTETSFDGRALLNGFGKDDAVGSLGDVLEPAIADVIHVLHNNARMGINMANVADFTIAPLHPSQIYINTTALSVAVADATARTACLDNITNGIFAAATAMYGVQGDVDVSAHAASITGTVDDDGEVIPGAVVATGAIAINDLANRTIAETVTDCARTIVSAQNAKIEGYLAIIEDAMNSLGEDLITNNSAVASLANTDYMQSSEESKNALQAMLSGMAVLSTFQA